MDQLHVLQEGYTEVVLVITVVCSPTAVIIVVVHTIVSTGSSSNVW